jgi:hypothetical protein
MTVGKVFMMPSRWICRFRSWNKQKPKRSAAPPSLPGANPAILSYNAGVVKIYKPTDIKEGFKNALAYYNADAVNSCKFKSRRIGSWSQSYVRGLQRQSCKFLQRHRNLALFEIINILFHFEKRSSLLQRWRFSCKFKSCRIGYRLTLKRIYWMGPTVKLISRRIVAYLLKFSSTYPLNSCQKSST